MMNDFSRLFPTRGPALAVLGLAGAVLLISADPAAALNKSEIRCRDTIARTVRAAAGQILEARTGCVRLKIGAEIDNAVDCAADPPSLGGTGTGHGVTDVRLGKFERNQNKAAARLTRKCDNKNLAKDVDPVDIGADTLSPCGGSCADWAAVGFAAAEIGKAQADTIFEVFDVQPSAGASSACYGSVSHQARKALAGMNLFRARCYRTDDKLLDGGGVFDCDANISPPGVFETTGDPKTDERLEYPLDQLSIIAVANCDVDLDLIGFESVMTERTGGDFLGRFTVDDVYDNVNDAVHRQVLVAMEEIFPVGAFCGDGAADAGESCDNADSIGDDGCDRDCTTASCGNGTVDGVVTGNEECDDGNIANGDGCNSLCETEYCGNGDVNPGWEEECDAAGESVACDTDCTLAICGDNFLNVTAGEQCEPPVGNGPDQCRDGSGIGAPCQLPACLDGVVDTGEECDDATETLACDFNCTNAFCGDGDTNATRGETCDDGDAVDTDMCPSSDVNGAPYCITATCGDGFVCSDADECTTGPAAGPEVCDDGGLSASCDTDCSTAECGDGFTNALNTSAPATAAGEQCDDGDLLDGDGCDSNCTTTACGNAIVTPGTGEQCDDGATANGDGCDSACIIEECGNGKVQSGETCDGNGAGTGGETAACDDNCTAASCGDGTLNVTALEDCDGGGETASCDSNCTFAVCGDGTTNGAAGETCDDSGESAACDSNCTGAMCGDGTINTSAGEQCDDSNTNPGDGCSATCQVE